MTEQATCRRMVGGYLTVKDEQGVERQVWAYGFLCGAPAPRGERCIEHMAGRGQ